jgi:hypothetical protein
MNIIYLHSCIIADIFFINLYLKAMNNKWVSREKYLQLSVPRTGKKPCKRELLGGGGGTRGETKFKWFTKMWRCIKIQNSTHVCPNITSKYHTNATLKSLVRQNNDPNKTCRLSPIYFTVPNSICVGAGFHELSQQNKM